MQPSRILFIPQKKKRATSHAPPESESVKLEHLMGKSRTPLLQIETVFPFDFFPDTLIVDTTKVHIIIREFFASEEIHSIPIANIVDVYVETGPLFATLRILPQLVFEHQVTEITKLWKTDAVKARDMIQGLIVAIKEDIDVSKLPEEEDVSKLQHELIHLGQSPKDY